MKVSLEEVTVKKAQEWLTRNDKNRPVRQAVVKHYARVIDRNEWQVNGDTIKFNCDGTLVDGQHRLYAVIMSGKSIKTYVAREVPANAFDTIDQGTPRTLADGFGRHGEQNCKALGSAMRTLAWLLGMDEEKKGGAAWVRLTIKQAVELLDQHPGIRSSVRPAMAAQKVIPMSCGIPLHYLFSKKDQTAADLFFDALASGESLRKSDPVYRLRERMLDRKRGQRVQLQLVLALTIKAWNATRQGRSLQSLGWRHDEAFPEIA